MHQQLGLELTEMGLVKVKPPFDVNTSVEGVYAAGDITGFLQGVPRAMYTGSNAGLMGATTVQAEQYDHEPFFH